MNTPPLHEPVATFEGYDTESLKPIFTLIGTLNAGDKLCVCAPTQAAAQAAPQAAQQEVAREPLAYDARLREEVSIMYQLLDAGEWAEHIAATAHGQNLETAITRLIGKAKVAASLPDVAMPEPIYQIYDLTRQAYDDVVKEDFDSEPADNRRIVYLAAQPAEGSAQVANNDHEIDAAMSLLRVAQSVPVDKIAPAKLREQVKESTMLAQGGNGKGDEYIFADTYSYITELIGPYVASGAATAKMPFPGSVCETVEMLLDHWKRTTTPTAASKALDAAPAIAAEGGTQAGLEQTIIEQRIALTPENEGGWHAMRYGDSDEPISRGYGLTPSEAVKQVQQAIERIDGTTQGAQGDGDA